MAFFDRIFNPARSQSNAWNLFKTLFQTSLFWLLFLLILPKSILLLEAQFELSSFQPNPLLGWCLFICFGMLGLSSGATMSLIGKGTPLPMDCPNKLVIKGPYKMVRNPMAVAGIMQGVSVGIILGSYWIILYALSGALLWHIAVRPSEERDLEKRFGTSFLQYKKNTWCWIPKLW